MISWVTLVLASAPAQAATWTYRAPVPVKQPIDGKGFKLCLDLPAKLQMEPVTVENGGVTLTCSSTEDSTSLCYEIGQPWPERWEPMTCESASTKVRINFIPAFDPSDSVMDGAVVISGSVDEIAAVYGLPPGVWPEQTHKGARGTICRVEDQRLWVWREGTRRGKGTCEIRDRFGNDVRFTVRFGRVK